jgi:glycosyltransferase involved in cell wall biosynthesis
MKYDKIIVTADGDPLSPKTWSGTPMNISKEFNRLQLLAGTLNFNDYRNNKIANKLIEVFSRIYYNNSVYDLRRGAFHRYASSYFLNRRVRKATCNSVLHTSTLTLPLIGKSDHIKNFLFCDSTWNLWSKHSANKELYSKKLLEDAEKLERKSYEQMHHIFPAGDYIKNNLIDHYGISKDKITVVGTGRGAIKPYFGQKDYKAGHILFVAKERFEDKGGYLLLEAFKKALVVNPKLKLVIIGQDYYKDFIKGIPNVEVFGFVSLEKLQNTFEQASLYIMPSLNEPWGLVYLEALSCKVPIVGLNRNAFPELCQYGENGYVLNGTNTDNLKDLILYCFDHPEELKTKGEKGQAYCLKNHTWENTVEIMKRVIMNE